jgi:hypothetical protein
MSITRDEMLDRLKTLPETRLAELIFRFSLDDTVASSLPTTGKAIELIKAIEVLGVDDWSRLESLVMPEQVSSPAPTEPDFRISDDPLARHAPAHLVGRDEYFARLEAALADPGTHVVTLVAWGGVGKTSLVAHWLGRLAHAGWTGIDRVFTWSFYSQGTREKGAASADGFLAQALAFFGDDTLDPTASARDKGLRIAELAAGQRTLLVLDSLEPLQYPPGPMAGSLQDPGIEALLQGLSRARRTSAGGAFCVVTTRESVADLAAYQSTTAPEWNLEQLAPEAGAAVLWQAGARKAGDVDIDSDDAGLLEVSREVDGHALTLGLLGSYLGRAWQGDMRRWREVDF